MLISTFLLVLPLARLSLADSYCIFILLFCSGVDFLYAFTFNSSNGFLVCQWCQ
uniref:Uncharacterized protein n=1 Tax=Rhizophora mucronata TaxID=61149 RepID=A0A2P2NUG0_RHIMU